MDIYAGHCQEKSLMRKERVKLAVRDSGEKIQAQKLVRLLLLDVSMTGMSPFYGVGDVLASWTLRTASTP